MGKIFISGAGRSTEPGSRLPAGYSELVYIQSNGTQHINTLFNPSNNTRVVATVAWISSGAGIFGARASNTGFILYNESSQGNTYYTMFARTYATTGVLASSEAKIEVDMNGPAGTVTVAGTTKSLASGTFSLSYPMFLFAFNDSGNASLKGSVRIYACQIYDNGTLVRDFVPCISDADGIGLYDLVEGKFYGNAGSGSFIGSEVA